MWCMQYCVAKSNHVLGLWLFIINLTLKIKTTSHTFGCFNNLAAIAFAVTVCEDSLATALGLYNIIRVDLFNHLLWVVTACTGLWLAWSPSLDWLNSGMFLLSVVYKRAVILAAYYLCCVNLFMDELPQKLRHEVLGMAYCLELLVASLNMWKFWVEAYRYI